MSRYEKTLEQILKRASANPLVEEALRKQAAEIEAAGMIDRLLREKHDPEDAIRKALQTGGYTPPSGSVSKARASKGIPEVGSRPATPEMKEALVNPAGLKKSRVPTLDEIEGVGNHDLTTRIAKTREQLRKEGKVA